MTTDICVILPFVYSQNGFGQLYSLPLDPWKTNSSQFILWNIGLNNYFLQAVEKSTAFKEKYVFSQMCEN